jgi:hypothetical protein
MGKKMKHKSFILAFKIALICLLSVISIASVNALNQNEWSGAVSWSSSVYYQGDSGSVTFDFDSNCPEELKINYVGVHFDWMPSDAYYPLDLSANPIGIASHGSYTFNSIGFNIPSDVSVGQHSATILIKGQQHGLWWYDISVTASASITTHDAYEKVYNQLYPDVSNKLNNAENTNYKSPDAQSALQQANTEYNLAISLSQQGQWQDAVSHLNTASSYLDQAISKEQSYQSDNPLSTIGLSNNLIIVALAVIMIVVIIGVAIGMVLRRRNNQPRPFPAPHSIAFP